MPVYQYNALNQTGGLISGKLVAPSEPVVIEELSRKGLRPVEVKLATDEATGKTEKGRTGSAGTEVFLRQLANLLTAGVSLSRALNIIVKETVSPTLRQQWTAIRDEVVGGSSLSSALSKWPNLFSRICVAMVQAGETGGFLNLALEQVADFQEREQDLKNRVRSALIYPFLLGILAAGVMVFLLVFFIPRFSSIFAEFGASLPVLTRGIVRLSQFLLRYGLLLLAAVTVIFAGIRQGMSTEKGRKVKEKFMLSLPLWGPVLARLALVRFCRVFGTLLASGVPLVTALNVSREAAGYTLLSEGIQTAIDEVKSGVSLARGLACQRLLFPLAVLEMVSVAEESGRLD
ncbi:MAG: type II secretion system F family protein, partial [Candidatus Omnitrophica bacterium]|nr:type II secretion system F family protein [Candidatus Omnitrophota bacterium]